MGKETRPLKDTLTTKLPGFLGPSLPNRSPVQLPVNDLESFCQLESYLKDSANFLEFVMYITCFEKQSYMLYFMHVNSLIIYLKEETCLKLVRLIWRTIVRDAVSDQFSK